ncbi:MAG TPA: PLP-dependent aminotransferase family protein [Gemmatimonadaceae bacterium]|nr:PLP-dependent aminotransferase family protein [Gemmatimonadaceae bacterium]
MEIHVSLIDRTHLGAEVYRQLRQAIVDGRLRPGDRLPASRELARRLGVSRTTVTVAYDRLAGEGFVTSRVGAGTFVSHHAGRTATTSRGDGRPREGGALRPRPDWTSVPLPSAFDRPARFDFRTGLPDVALFPHDAWRRLMGRALRAGARAAGVYAHPAGHRALREAIARHVGLARAVRATADDVTVTSGTQQALDVVARVLLAPGDRVAVEDPGYAPPRRLFTSLGARVQGVPVDGEGLVVDALPRHTRLVYVTPSHQYPLGVPMSLARRLALLDWAERHDAAIVEDDYDSEFRFHGRPIEPLQTLDRSGRVIYVGSFSKTLLPTLRLGFLVTPPSLRGAVHRAKYVTDWHTAIPAQAALARFIDEGGFARHVRRMNAVYRARHDLVTGTLARCFADQLEVVPSAAGLHVAALARPAVAQRMAAVVQRASEAGVEVHDLTRFAVEGAGRAGLVLGYGAIPTADVEEGLRRLRACFDD